MKYKGWDIQGVYKYTTGKADYQYYPPDGEPGYILAYSTYEMLCEIIDEKILDELLED